MIDPPPSPVAREESHPLGPLLAPFRHRVHAALDRLPRRLAELILFGLKQAWACLFAALMLALLIGTDLAWGPDWPLYRYDALLLAALVIQLAFLLLKLESLDEAKVILIYHVVGTAMEIFKTRMGSWTYPEAAMFRIGEVPLFTGFMYAAVGSYMARVIRIFDMRFTNYPRFGWTALLAAAIYANFFTHHFTIDLRYVLFAWTLLLFGRVRVYFRTDRAWRWMPLIVAALLTALFLWVAENIGTATGTWLYPGSRTWRLVSLQKLGSWYLLLIVSFVLVTIVNRPQPRTAAAGDSARVRVPRPVEPEVFKEPARGPPFEGAGRRRNTSQI